MFGKNFMTQAIVGSGEDQAARMRFMRIDAVTGDLLREFWTVVEPELPDILEGFYRHVTAEPLLARLIGNNIPRLKAAQASHWARLFNGRFDNDYMHGVRAIGLVHNRIGLEPRWYIGGYNFVLNRLVNIAVTHYRWRTSRLKAVLSAVNCAVMLDMDLAISVYQEAMLEQRAHQQNRIAAAIADFDGRINTVLATVSGSAKGLKEAADALAANAEESTRQSSAVAAGSEEASANVQAVASATEQLTSSVREIGRQVAESTRISSKAVDQAHQSGTSIDNLAESAQKIGAVVELINSIAAQTNLLALNATIEAARAGEAGRGFAVVASEVKALAEQTARATEEIGQQVLAIQAATRQSVSAIGAIGTTIGSVNEIATTIAAAIEQQGMATAEIARNIQEAAHGTREVSGNISGVSEAAGETRETAMQLLSSAGQLSVQAETMRASVEDFFAAIRAA
jgi:methyl-accepting chemotaxis protein